MPHGLASVACEHSDCSAFPQGVNGRLNEMARSNARAELLSTLNTRLVTNRVGHGIPRSCFVDFLPDVSAREADRLSRVTDPFPPLPPLPPLPPMPPVAQPGPAQIETLGNQNEDPQQPIDILGPGTIASPGVPGLNPRSMAIYDAPLGGADSSESHEIFETWTVEGASPSHPHGTVHHEEISIAGKDGHLTGHARSEDLEPTGGIAGAPPMAVLPTAAKPHVVHRPAPPVANDLPPAEVPEPHSLRPAAVVGGAVAVLAQVYLWGTIFVNVFKPQRRTQTQTAEIRGTEPAMPQRIPADDAPGTLATA